MEKLQVFKSISELRYRHRPLLASQLWKRVINLTINQSKKKSEISVLTAYGLLAATVLSWSIGIVIARGVHEDIPPIGLSFWRWAVATVILFPFVFSDIRNNLVLIRQNLGYFWIQGIFMTGGGMLLFLAVNYTTAINVTLVNATQPILTVLISWILIGDKIAKIQVLGIVSAMVGVTFMITKADFTLLRNLDFNIGDLITVVATIFYSLYAVNLRNMPKGLNVFSALLVILFLGSLTLLPFYIVEEILIRPTIFSFQLALSVLVLSLIVSILSLSMWNSGNARVGHNRAAIFVNLFPVYSAILAIIFLDESLYLFHFIGAFFVCGGIFLVVKSD